MLADLDDLRRLLTMSGDATRDEISAALASKAPRMESHELFLARHLNSVSRRIMASTPTAANEHRAQQNAYTRAVEEADAHFPAASETSPVTTVRDLTRAAAKGPAQTLNF
jgi:hypothetical protein